MCDYSTQSECQAKKYSMLVLGYVRQPPHRHHTPRLATIHFVYTTKGKTKLAFHQCTLQLMYTQGPVQLLYTYHQQTLAG